MHYCQWRSGRSCGASATISYTTLDDQQVWLCAEHYDRMVVGTKECAAELNDANWARRLMKVNGWQF